jgi:hypothetical protein
LSGFFTFEESGCSAEKDFQQNSRIPQSPALVYTSACQGLAVDGCCPQQHTAFALGRLGSGASSTFAQLGCKKLLALILLKPYDRELLIES